MHGRFSTPVYLYTMLYYNETKWAIEIFKWQIYVDLPAWMTEVTPSMAAWTSPELRKSTWQTWDKHKINGKQIGNIWSNSSEKFWLLLGMIMANSMKNKSQYWPRGDTKHAETAENEKV